MSPLLTLKGCITEPVINQSPFLKVTGSSLNSSIIHLIASFGPARFSPLKKGSVTFPFKLISTWIESKSILSRFCILSPITNQSAYYIGGTKSSIQFPNYKEWYNKSERSWWKPILHKDESTRESRYTLTNQINHLCDVVNKKAKPKITGEDGLISLKIFAAIIKSSKTGKKIKIK